MGNVSKEVRWNGQNGRVRILDCMDWAAVKGYGLGVGAGLWTGWRIFVSRRSEMKLPDIDGTSIEGRGRSPCLRHRGKASDFACR